MPTHGAIQLVKAQDAANAKFLASIGIKTKSKEEKKKEAKKVLEAKLDAEEPEEVKVEELKGDSLMAAIDAAAAKSAGLSAMNPLKIGDSGPKAEKKDAVVVDEKIVRSRLLPSCLRCHSDNSGVAIPTTVGLLV